MGNGEALKSLVSSLGAQNKVTAMYLGLRRERGALEISLHTLTAEIGPAPAIAPGLRKPCVLAVLWEEAVGAPKSKPRCMFLRGCKIWAPTDLSHSSVLNLQYATLKDGAASLFCQEQTVYHSLWKQGCPKAQCSSPITSCICQHYHKEYRLGKQCYLMPSAVLRQQHPVSLARGSHISASIHEGKCRPTSIWPENGSSYRRWATM